MSALMMIAVVGEHRRTSPLMDGCIPAGLIRGQRRSHVNRVCGGKTARHISGTFYKDAK